MSTNADFIRCRAGGHMWDDDTAGWKRKPLFGFRISWRCLRCGSWRHYLIDSNGDVGSRGYDYADGYQYAKGEYVPSRGEFRIMLLKQQARERRKAREAAKKPGRKRKAA